MARQALDVAKYVIHKCHCDGKAISNLQLQKILYYMQGLYLANFREPLFEDKIEAWKFGPVVPNIYYAYNKYIADNIYETYPDIENILRFSKEEKEFLDKIIIEKRELSVWQLVELTHKEKPWRQAYTDNMSNTITQRNMMDFFLNE